MKTQHGIDCRINHRVKVIREGKNERKWLEQSEKMLKRFAKKSKEISYSTALLVTFLITGFVSYAQPDETIMTRTELSEELAQKKVDVDNLLKRNKKELRGLDLKIEQLLRRGVFWVKPLDLSYQFFFNGDWELASEAKDRTSHNFNSDEYTPYNTFNEYINDLSVPHSLSEMVYNGKYLGNMGILKRKYRFVDRIDFGVNIQPKDVTEKELKVPEVVGKDVAMVEFNPPKAPHIVITAPETTIPIIKVLDTPATPVVKVNEPEKINPLEPISIAKIDEINIDVPIPATVQPGKVNAPVITQPSAPEGFKPKFILPPEIPAVPVIESPTVEVVTIHTASDANGDGSWLWDPKGDNGLISQVIMDSGNWDIKVHTGGSTASYDTEITNYNARIPKIYNKDDTEVNASHKETNIGSGKAGIYRVIGAPYSNLGKKTVVNIDATARTDTETFRQFVHYDPHGNKGVPRKDGKIDATLDNFDGAVQSELDELKNLEKYEVKSNNGDLDMVFSMQGIVNVKGNSIDVVGLQGHCGPFANSYVLHSGKTNIEGNHNIALAFTNQKQEERRNAIISNYCGGEINIKGNKNYAIVFDRDKTPITSLTFVNTGKIELNGDENVGALLKRMANGGTLDLQNPIVIADGKKNIGVFHSDGDLPELNPDLSNIRVKILKGNENIAFVELNDQTVNSVNLDINSGDKNILVYPKKDKTVTAKSGTMNIGSGTGNIGVIAKEGSVDFSGVDFKIGDNSKNTFAVLTHGNNRSVKLKKLETGKVINSGLLFAEDGAKIEIKESKIKLESDSTINKSKGETLAYATAVGAGSEITINETSTPGTPNIEIKGGKFSDAPTVDVGFALMAKDGAVVNAKNNNIKVVNGSTAIASIGENSNVDLEKSIVDYEGTGYAIYSDGQGKVNFHDATLILRGKSTAFDVDLNENLSVFLNQGSRIKVMSDDVVVFSLKNATGLTTVGGVEKAVTKAIQDKLASSGNLGNIFDGTTATKYKVAAVDGGDIKLGSLDKTGTADSTEGPKRDGFQYYNRFLGQRLKATTEPDSIISAIQNNAQAAEFHNQVVALEMNSSNKARTADETEIKLVKSTLKADRIDSGAGGVGAFINYGTLDIDSDSQILVEMETGSGNVKNKNAIGAYAVNGSIVKNDGTIKAGGENSIGILGMAYRTEGTDIKKNEFGENANGQGKITITNNGTITLNDANGIGIYAENNNPDTSISLGDNMVKNTGKITVGDTKPGGVAIGMYGERVTLAQDSNGEINVGKDGIGFFSKGAIVGVPHETLGTVKFGDDGGVGIYVTGNGDTASINAEDIIIDNTGKKGIVGVYVDLTENKDSFTTNVEVKAKDENITAYHSNSSDIKVHTDLTLTKGSRGMTAAPGKGMLYKGKMLLPDDSTGISGIKNPITLLEDSDIKLQGKNTIGIYSEGDALTKMFGTVTLENDKTIGIYAKDNTSVELDDHSNVKYGPNGKESIATYLAGSTMTAKTVDPSNPTSIVFAEHPDKKNILIYMQGIKCSDGATKGSELVLSRKLKVSPVDKPTGSQRTIGVYMDTSLAGENNKFASNTVQGSARVENQGIAVYSKNLDESGNAFNIFNSANIASSGENTAGVFLNGNIKVSGNSTLAAEKQGVGIYGNKGIITIDGTNTITVKEEGTGIYMNNGSHLKGGTLVLKNLSENNKAVGLYYNKGTGTDEITHDTVLSIPEGNLMLGFYLDDGVKVKNTADVSIDKGKGNTVAYVVGGSEFTNNGNITIGETTDFTQALGIYVDNGKATNTGTITLTDEKGTTANQSLSVAMAAINSGTDEAKIINEKDINVAGEAVGIYVEKEGIGENSGNIVATDTSDASGNEYKAIGAYINGPDAKFTNTGTISADNIAVAMEKSTTDNITLGNIEITADNGVAVFAHDSTINQDITPAATTKKNTIALYAAGETAVNGKVTSLAGAGHIGVYLNDNKVTFGNDSKVIVNNGLGTDYGIGLFVGSGYSGDVKVDIEQKGKETMGMFLEGGTAGAETKVTYDGTINVGEGIGVFVPENSEFVADTTTFNIDGGAGIFVCGGKTSMGTKGTVSINFGTKQGSAIYQQGGTIDVGSNLQVTGYGTFLTIKNADGNVETVIPVMTEGTGLNAMYDATGGARDYTLKLAPNGAIRLLGDKATGISAAVKGLETTNNKVTIVNEGTIKTESGKKTVAILGKGASVTNKGNIDVGEEGIGIFATSSGTGTDGGAKITNGKIVLTGDKAAGIVVDNMRTDETVEPGKVEAKGKEQIGIFIKETPNGNKITVADYEFVADHNGTGAIFDNGEFKFTTANPGDKNSITIGDAAVGEERGMGIAVVENADGNVENTDIVLGENGIGLFAENAKVKFTKGEIKSDAKGSILVYASEGGEITLDTPQIKVNPGVIGIASDGGKVLADSQTTVKVEGENGVGIFVAGDATNPGIVSNNYKVVIKQPGGIGIYAKGKVGDHGILDSMNCDGARGYIYEDMLDTVNIPAGALNLGQNGEKDQIGVYARGTGQGLETNGIDIKGEGNIGVYNAANQDVTNSNGMVLADNSGNSSSIGIYSDTSSDDTTARTVTAAGDMKVGVNNVGVYAKNAKVVQSGAGTDVTVGSKAIGVLAENTEAYYNNGHAGVVISDKMAVGDNEGVGVQTVNSDIEMKRELTVGDNDSKGIYATGKGDIKLDDNLVVGKDSVVVYKKGEGKITTTTGKTVTVAEEGYGIYADGAVIENDANLAVDKKAVGLAGTKNITSTADIDVKQEGIGILGKGDGTAVGTITVSGTMGIGDFGAIGIYGDNADINILANTKVDIGANNSMAIFSLGKGDITLNSVQGKTTTEVPVGIDSIGIYKKGTGKIDISNVDMKIVDKGYGIYYIGETGLSEIENSSVNMELGTEAVGVYARNAVVNHDGNIKVGATTLGADGYNKPKNNKNSIGIFGQNSDITYHGDMTVDKELSVGIYGFADTGKTGSITIKDGSTIKVRNGAIGIMAGGSMGNITIEKNATIDVSGSTNGGKNKSVGIVSYGGNINNLGKIKVSNGALALHKGVLANLLNKGTIEIDAATGGQELMTDGINSTGDLGGVKIDMSGKVTIDGKVVNGGVIKIRGDLAMEGMGIDISTGNVAVEADNVEGLAKVLPNFSKGNSVRKYTVEDVFRTSPQGIGAFSGDVTSASVSWIAKVSKELGSTATRDITVARIPYPELIVGEKYENLAYGLEELRMDIPSTESSSQFKSMDGIHTHEQFAEAVADIRGDIYSNIQERMQTVENSFDRSYRELLDSFNVTRNVRKFSIINTNGRHKDDTLGVAGYKYDSAGVLYLRDNERYSYGGKFGWSAGLMGTRFKFTGDTNEGSKEKVLSGKLGLHYQRAMVERDENARLKYLGRAELTLNRHRARRYSRIGGDEYKARATYYSADISLRNRLLYDYDINTQWTLRPYLGVDLSYGRFSNIRERDNEFDLKVKHNDYYLVTPNVGVETKYRVPVAGDKEVVLKADAQVDYDAHKLYTGANKAKLKRTSTGYYELSEPERERVRTGVGAEIGVEKPNNYGVAFRVEYNDNKKSNMTYGVRFNYKF